MEHHELKIHLPGLLKLLGSNIYSSPEVAVREMVQNAHDTCIIRTNRDRTFASPRIDISYDWEALELKFSDNGAGMTEAELHNYLSTIGAGFTKIEKQRLQLEGAHDARLLIGQFGIGMLAAFSIATRVEVLTRSYLPGSQGLKWSCDGDIHYQVEKIAVAAPGTQVVLHLTTRGLPLLEDARLIQAVKKYADFLSVPIFLKNRQVNACIPPWEMQQNVKEYESYINARYGLKALTVIPFTSTEPVLLGSLLFIPALPKEFVREFGDLDIYISRMFVKSEERRLLPPWARFIKGVLNTEAVEPIASRDDFQLDQPTQQHFQNSLGTAILTHLGKLAATDQGRLGTIVATYNSILKNDALACDKLFDIVADYARVKTDTGNISVRDYLNNSQGILFYTTEPTSSAQQRLLSDYRRTPIIDASFGIEEQFLMKYATRNSVLLKKGSGAITQGSVAKQEWASLEHRFREVLRGGVKVTTFDPSSIPALIAEPGSPANPLGPDQSTPDASDRKHASGQGTLQVNMSNPLIQQLVHVENNTLFQLAVHSLYSSAVLFARQYVSPEDAEVMLTTQNAVVSTMITTTLALSTSQGLVASLQARLDAIGRKTQPVLKTPFRSCFFAFDYKVDHNYVLLEEIQTYFRRQDLGIKIIAPARGIDELNLVKGLHEQLESVHFGLADFTSNSPNVLYEAGILRGLGKPVLYLRDQNDPNTIPFDIYSDYRLEYTVLRKHGMTKFAWIDAAFESALSAIMRLAPDLLNAPKWNG